MKLTIRAEIDIERPIVEVFKFVATDHRENHSRWDVAVSRLEPGTPGPLSLGSTFTIVRRNLGREEARTFEITDWNPPRRMTMTTSAPDFELSLKASFEPLDEQRTRHVLVGEARVSGPRALLAPVMKLKFGADIEENLRRIKTLIEADRLALAGA